MSPRRHAPGASVAHHPLTTWLHALMAVLLFGQLALGWWMLDLPKSPPGLRANWFNIHKSVGITLGALWLLRLAWLLARPQRLKVAMPQWQRLSAGLNHGLLYLCMGLLPISGLLGSGFSPYPVRWFGLALPRWSEPWPAAKELCSLVHTGAVWLMAACIVVHLLAVAWHVLSGDIDLLKSIRPRWQRRA